MKENNNHWDDTDDKLSEKDIKVVIVKKKKDRPLKWIERLKTLTKNVTYWK